MSATTVPVQTCDDEDGCDRWMIDYYALCANNWKDFLDGWQFDPYSPHDRDLALCTEHRN